MKPTAVADLGRVKNLVELGVTNHPEQERIERFLRSGASFFCRTEDDVLHISLMHGDLAEAYSILRGNDPPVPVDPEDVGEIVTIIRCPVDTCLPKPQG